MATLRALECFIAVAETGSITEAARKLFSSQPSVSRHVALLEREAGTALFRRGSRGVRLTDAGRAALSDARRAIDAAEAAVHAARETGGVARDTLRVACAQSLAVPLIAPAIQRWRTARPEVNVVLREATVIDVFLSMLDADEVDVAVVPLPVPSRYSSTPVMEEEIVLTVDRSHRLASKSTVELTDLDGERLVGYAAENGLGSWIDETLAHAEVATVTAVRTAVSAAGPPLAAAGMGVSIAPVSAVGDACRGVLRPFTPAWRRPLVAVTVSGADALVAHFVDDLRVHGLSLTPEVRRQLSDS